MRILTATLFITRKEAEPQGVPWGAEEMEQSKRKCGKFSAAAERGRFTG